MPHSTFALNFRATTESVENCAVPRRNNMKVHFTGCKIYLAYGNESFSDEILWCLTIESIAGKCCTVSPIIFFAPIHGPSFEISICRKYWIVAPISMCFIYVIHVATFTKPFNLLFRHFLYIFDLCCTCVCYSLCNNNTSYMDISSHYDHYVHTSKEALNMLKCLSHEHEIVQTDKKATHKRIEFNSQMVSILKRLQCLNEYLNEVVQCKEKKRASSSIGEPLDYLKMSNTYCFRTCVMLQLDWLCSLPCQTIFS